ncbi:hypothetical protein CDZ96_09405 [Mameliella alba]|nr:aldehyde dehydrogenase family protein [Mameliella alba]OWV48800.1 hypothetical protein CDZ96_09405 [Mameliella alba]
MGVVNPSTGTTLGDLASGGAADVDAVVNAARRAFEGEWRGWSPYQRQALLIRAYDLLERRFDELAEIESVDMGAPISKTRATKQGALRMIQFFAALALSIRGETSENGLPGDVTTMTLKAPAGVNGGIIPWNGSLTSVWWIVGAATATGCTTVLKPATEASLTVLYLAEKLLEIGLPLGVHRTISISSGPKPCDARAARKLSWSWSFHSGRWGRCLWAPTHVSTRMFWVGVSTRKP